MASYLRLSDLGKFSEERLSDAFSSSLGLHEQILKLFETGHIHQILLI